MSMKVIKQQLRQVSPQLYKQLHSLNFGKWDGTMQANLAEQRREKSGVVHYILDGTRLIGWSLLFVDYEHDNICHFYVRKSERRKGYGRQLVLANIRHIRRLKRKTFKVDNENDKGAAKFFREVRRSKYGKLPGKPLTSCIFY